MNRLFIFLLFATTSLVSAQTNKWVGDWTGVITVNGIPLDLKFTIREKYSGYVTKLNIPQQGLKDYAVSSTSIKNINIDMELETLEATFQGKRSDSNTLKGVFHQRSKNYNLVLKKTWGIWPVPKPQTPLPPFSYITQEVRFIAGQGRFNIAGSLSALDTVSKHPCIIFISGSGAQDRDGSIGNHHPFALLSDSFTKMGFAVLRCDDRGAGKTTGSPFAVQKTTSADQADDVEIFINYLKTLSYIDTNRMGLLGHSEGGIIAPMVAARRNDINFLVLLAAPAFGGKEINAYQNEVALKKGGMKKQDLKSYMKLHHHLLDAIVKLKDTDAFRPVFDSILLQWKKKESTLTLRKRMIGNSKSRQELFDRYASFFNPWWKFFLAYNPQVDLEKLHCKVLALNGSKDNQVPAYPNLDLIKESLSKANNSKATILELDGLNHLFQTCKTCDLTEYFTTDETFSLIALKEITGWLRKNIQK